MYCIKFKIYLLLKEIHSINLFKFDRILDKLKKIVKDLISKHRFLVLTMVDKLNYGCFCRMKVHIFVSMGHVRVASLSRLEKGSPLWKKM